MRETSVGYLLYTPGQAIKPAAWVELDPQPSGIWDGAQPTEPPGQGDAVVSVRLICRVYILTPRHLSAIGSQPAGRKTARNRELTSLYPWLCHQLCDPG